jgi:hypothetical protein
MSFAIHPPSIAFVEMPAEPRRTSDLGRHGGGMLLRSQAKTRGVSDLDVDGSRFENCDNGTAFRFDVAVRNSEPFAPSRLRFA